MKSKQLVKWVALALLLALMSTAVTTGTAVEPQATEPAAISCGDSANCTLGTPAVQVVNHGVGPAIKGRSAASKTGIRGIGQPGVKGSSGGGNGVEGISETNAGVWAQGYVLDADLVLAGNNSSFHQGVISSDPDYANSDFYLVSHNDVYVFLDKEDDGSGEFKIQDRWSAGETILTVNEEGDLRIDDDLYLARNGGHGRIYADAANSSDLYLYSNDHMVAHLDENDDGPETSCFRIRSGGNSLLWEQCESKGTTTVGSQAVAVETSSGSREMYTIGSPGLWFEDFGSATLVDGQANVTIDALFAETVSLDAEYHVYLTPVSSEAVLLFVTAKTPTAFEVQGVTLDGSPASASFDYRIVAKRLGYENQRLEQVDLTPSVEAEP